VMDSIKFARADSMASKDFCRAVFIVVSADLVQRMKLSGVRLMNAPRITVQHRNLRVFYLFVCLSIAR